MSTHDLAWAAGFFDGDGCTYLQTNRGQNYTCVMLSIHQKDHRVLDKWFDIFKIGTFSFDENKLHYQWHTNSFEYSQHIICLIWPWLGEAKREQYVNVTKKYLESRKYTLARVRSVRVEGERTTLRPVS